MKLTRKFIRYVNVYTSQIIQQGFLIYIQPNTDILILEKDNKTLDNFSFYEKKEFIFKEQDIKIDYGILIDKCLDTKSYIKDSQSRYILQNEFFINELLLS